jgi:hypothetical protein
VRFDTAIGNLDIFANVLPPARLAGDKCCDILEVVLVVRNAIIAGLERFAHNAASRAR